MRGLRVLLLTAILGLFLSANGALAASYSEIQYQIGPGQNLEFEFDPILLSDGTQGYLTIEAHGDYFGKGPGGNENLNVEIDGIVAFTNVWFGEGSAPVTKWDTRYDDAWWTYTWAIDGSNMLDIISDQSVLVAVNLYEGVGYQFDESDWVKVTMEYNAVPIPGSLFLLGGGLIGLFRMRRKWGTE